MQAQEAPPRVRVEIAQKAHEVLFSPVYKRYKVLWGGRGGAKSWSIARALIAISYTRKVLILCTREFQNSIADSVHRLLSRQIEKMGLNQWFDIQKSTIVCTLTGSEFIFKGLHHNIQEIKSTEGVDICWVAEAQSCSKESWETLIPTIRSEPGRPPTEIWVDFNPIEEDDPTYVRFVLQPPPPERIAIAKINWNDNPFFPPDMHEERRYWMRTDPDAYDWIWEGHTRRIGEAAVFRNRFEVRSFATPETVERFFYGADWGFAQSPTVLVRSFIEDDCLYIDHESYGVGVEIDDIPALFEGGLAKKNGVVYEGIPEARKWPIKADEARPETISYMARQGFACSGADKWKGCVEDGIMHIKGFSKVIVHERCVHTAQEFRLYSYKIDKKTKQVLPMLEDKHNHCIDALRYSLDGYIQHRGGSNIWDLLGR